MTSVASGQLSKANALDLLLAFEEYREKWVYGQKLKFMQQR